MYLHSNFSIGWGTAGLFKQNLICGVGEMLYRPVDQKHF